MGAAIDPRRAANIGLIPVAIVRAIGSPDVRRQRDVADRVDRVVDGSAVRVPQTQEPPAVKAPFEDLAVQRASAFEDDTGARLELLARMHERFPECVAAAADEQAFDGSAARHAAAEKARRVNP